MRQPIKDLEPLLINTQIVSTTPMRKPATRSESSKQNIPFFSFLAIMAFRSNHVFVLLGERNPPEQVIRVKGGGRLLKAHCRGFDWLIMVL